MHENRFRETNSFARQPFDARAQREMFALNLLGVELTDRVGGGGKRAVVDSSGIRVEVPQAKGVAQLF